LVLELGLGSGISLGSVGAWSWVRLTAFAVQAKSWLVLGFERIHIRLRFDTLRHPAEVMASDMALRFGRENYGKRRITLSRQFSKLLWLIGVYRCTGLWTSWAMASSVLKRHVFCDPKQTNKQFAWERTCRNLVGGLKKVMDGEVSDLCLEEGGVLLFNFWN
jgi:hypothetical protein